MISKIKNIIPQKAIIIAAVAALLVISSLTYVYAFNGNILGWEKPRDTIRDTNSVDYGPSTTEQKTSGAQIKTGSTDIQPTPSPVPGSSKKNVQLTITVANQNGSTLQVRILIGTVENTGQCTLILTKSGQQTITKTAGIQALASTSTCQGFDIPTSELSVGTWQLSVSYDSTSLTGTSDKTDVIIN